MKVTTVSTRILLFILAFGAIFIATSSNIYSRGVPASELDVDNGLVFLDGRYIPGPYGIDKSIADDRVVVSIQGRVVQSIEFATEAIQHQASQAVAPGEFSAPPGVENLSDSGYTRYLNMLLAYHIQEHGLQAALDRVFEHAEQCRLVSRVERHGDELFVFDRQGDPYGVSAKNIMIVTPPTRAQAAGEADRTLAAYRHLLSQGGAIMIFHDCRIFIPEARVRDVLLPSLRILEDDSRTKADKRDAFARLWENHPKVDAIVKNYRPSSELWEGR